MPPLPTPTSTSTVSESASPVVFGRRPGSETEPEFTTPGLSRNIVFSTVHAVRIRSPGSITRGHRRPARVVCLALEIEIGRGTGRVDLMVENHGKPGLVQFIAVFNIFQLIYAFYDRYVARKIYSFMTACNFSVEHVSGSSCKR